MPPRCRLAKEVGSAGVRCRTAPSSAASLQQRATTASCTDPPAAMVSCSELLCVRERQAGGRSATVPHSQTPGAASAARRRLTSQARPLGQPPASLLPPHFAGAAHANSTWQAMALSNEPFPGRPGHPHLNPSPPLRSLDATPAAHLSALTGKASSPRPSPARQITIDCNGSLEIRPLTGASRVSMVCGGERRITAGS